MPSAGSKIHGRTCKLTPVSAQRSMTSELNISGGHVLVVLATSICLGVPLVWAFLKYWLFAP